MVLQPQLQLMYWMVQKPKTPTLKLVSSSLTIGKMKTTETYLIPNRLLRGLQLMVWAFDSIPRQCGQEKENKHDKKKYRRAKGKTVVHHGSFKLDEPLQHTERCQIQLQGGGVGSS
jgi:hypothetical protein